MMSPTLHFFRLRVLLNCPYSDNKFFAINSFQKNEPIFVIYFLNCQDLEPNKLTGSISISNTYKVQLFFSFFVTMLIIS